MPSYLAPGVYVEEIPSGPPPIEGVGTSTAGFVGVTRRGPTEGRPRLVTNYGEFVRLYGGAFNFPAPLDTWNQLPFAVRGFFANGGRRLYVMRVAPTTASPASAQTQGGLVTRITRDIQATQTVARLATLRGIRTGTNLQFQMTKNGITTTSAVLTVNAVNRATGEVTLSAQVHATMAFEARYTAVFSNIDGANAAGAITTLASPMAARPASFTLRASNPGSWGRDLRVSPSHQSAARSIVQTAVMAPGNDIPLLSAAGFYVGAWVEIDRGNASANQIYRRVTAIQGNLLTVDGPAFGAATDLDPVPPVTETRISTCEFALTITYEDPVEHTISNERFEGLTLEDVRGRFYVDQLRRSTMVEVDTAVAPAGTHPFFFPSAPDGLNITLGTSGSDGTAAPTTLEVQGSDLGPGRKTGLLAMEEVDEVAILAAPGITDRAVQSILIEQCERLMDRFAVLDPAPAAGGGPATLDDIQNQAAQFDTKYAAIYYPRVMIADPDPAGTGAPIPVAPSGHMVGIYARVDETRGVHKAPANEVIRGIVDIETYVSRAQQEILNPRNINVLRDMRADRRGLRAYGARCLTSDSPWRHINVRRLFIMVEESLDEGTQWSVFEPNDQRLWARVRESVTIFLTRVWRDGALFGATPEEAFFVKCDRETMSDDDIQNGRLVMEIGIAPVRPAEFVIIRIGQWLGGSSAQEL
jgi:phage tail sheath protein FI